MDFPRMGSGSSRRALFAVDGISLHRYYVNEATGEIRGDTFPQLALNLAMEEQIAQVAAVCEYVRKRTGSSKRLSLSFDERNV